MKAETIAALADADQAIANARKILSVNIPVQSARLAYYAQFYAAQALIFGRTGNVSKTHKGVNTEFHELAMAEPTFAPNLAAQLTKAYDYKEIADYNASLAPTITTTLAHAAIVTAEQFVAAIRQVLASPPPAAASSP